MQARATFFCSGQAADAHPDLVRHAALAGHDIGTHLWEHHRDRVNDRLTFLRDLDRSLVRLTEITGRPVRFLRFPYGYSGRVQHADFANRGLRSVHWTLSGCDSRVADPDRIVARLMAAARPGAIFLLHDAIPIAENLGPPYLKTREQTVAALPALLGALLQQGLVPVTLGELLG